MEAKLESQDQKINEILDLLKRQAVPFSERLLTAAECAQYLNIKERKFKEDIATSQNFPEPIILDSNATRKHSWRWKAKDVQNWLDIVKQRN